MKFNHSCPTTVNFGWGILENIKDLLPSGFESVLLISTETAAEKSGALSVINNKFNDVEYANSIKPNPTLDQIDNIITSVQGKNFDCIIAVGGGSVIDAAKIIALALSSKLNAKQLLTSDINNIEPVYLIAVPTTSGTGSEVSKGAIVTDTVKKWKGGIRGNNVFPKMAILDPQLTSSLPLNVTLETGFDVITHALESLISKARTPITALYSKEALSVAIKALVEGVENGFDKQQRENLMYASLLAGYNLANASTCLPHRLQYPLGAHTNCAHARGLAALYPAWVRHVELTDKEAFNYFRNILIDSLKLSPSLSTSELVISFLEKIKMRHKLTDFGTSYEDCMLYASEVDGNLALDPSDTSITSLEKIFKEAL